MGVTAEYGFNFSFHKLMLWSFFNARSLNYTGLASRKVQELFMLPFKTSERALALSRSSWLQIIRMYSSNTERDHFQ